MKTIIGLGIVATTKEECECGIKNQNFVTLMRQPKTSRTKFIMTYRLALFKHLAIMVVWQSVPCKVKNNCRVKGIFEDYFRKHCIDLEIIFITKRRFRLHSYTPTLKEEKEYSSETLVNIYQTTWRQINEERSHENLQSHKKKNILFQHFSKSVMPENICVKIIFCIWAQIFFHKLGFCKCS